MGRKYQKHRRTIGNTPVVRINCLEPEGVESFRKIEASTRGSGQDRRALG